MTAPSPTYRKPKALPAALAAHTDHTTRGYGLLHAHQKLGVPMALLVELTGVKTATMAKIFDNTEVVPLENIKQTNRCLAAMKLLEELYVLPTTDYGSLRSIVGLSYTCNNLLEELEETKETLNG
jgi:hypothetical protein